MPSCATPILRLVHFHATWVLLVVVGCQTGNEPAQGIRIVAGGDVQDTVLAVLTEPLVVQYRDPKGQLLPGVPVLLEAVSFGPNGPRVLLQTDPSDQFRIVVTDTTDNAGQITVRVALGPSAGKGWVRATAGPFALSDSTSYVGLPGALASVEVAPNDTAVMVSRTLRLRGRTLDQSGNERGDALEWAGAPDVVTVDPTGLISGVRFGRATVRASAGALEDSVTVNVVPPGVVAAMFDPIAAGEPPHIVVFNTDGTGLTRLDLGALCAEGTKWTPSADLLLLNRNLEPNVCFRQRIYATTVTGSGRQILSDTIPLEAQYLPVMSADGQWIYFAGRPDHQNRELWRVRPDGSDAARIGPAAGSFDVYEHPSPAPSGPELVYASTPAAQGVPHLHVLNTTTGEDRDLGVVGTFPSWSPVGDVILFLWDGHYSLVGLDGSGERSLHSGGPLYPASWSPDGRWVVLVTSDPNAYAPAYGRLALVEVETGLVLPLGWTAQLTYPTWRPAP